VNSLAVERPLSFFALFALATLLLLPLWNELGAWYMTAVVVLVNNASAWTGLPPEFQFGALPGQEAINPGVAAGMALFIATPKRSVRWKLAWIIALVAFLCLWQSLLRLFHIYIAYAHFFTQLPWPQQLDYDAQIVLSLRPESFFATFVESGRYWTSLLCNVLIWLVATRRR